MNSSGVQGAEVDANLAAQDNQSVDHGVYATGVVQIGAASAAGILASDVIVQINTTTVTVSQSPGLVKR
jgi:S1-C subfamily serine protease